MNKRTKEENSTPIFSGDVKDAQARYGLGYNSIRALAEKSGAIIKVGTRVIYNFNKIDAYLSENTNIQIER